MIFAYCSKADGVANNDDLAEVDRDEQHIAAVAGAFHVPLAGARTP